MRDTLAHVLLSSRRPLCGLREEAILTSVAVFTQRNRQEERKGEKIKNTEARSKGEKQGWKEKAGDRRGGRKREGRRGKKRDQTLLKERNTEQEVGRIDFETQL